MVLNIRNNLKEKPIRLACMERGPGPGKYCLPGTCGVVLTHDPRKHTKPSYSFGTKHKLHNDFNRSPGPVYFVPPNLTRKGLRGAPRYSLVGRRRSPTLSCAPGPDSYRTEDVQPMKTPRPPCYSFGTRAKLTKVPANPAPNAYTLPTMTGGNIVERKTAASFSMTGRSLIGSFHQDFQNTPGPGTYKTQNASTTKTRVPSYSLKGRCYPPLSKGDVPGPGTYRPERVYINKRIGPSFSFGIRHSDYLASFETSTI